MSIMGIDGTIDVECDDCGGIDKFPAHLDMLAVIDWHCPPCIAKRFDLRKKPRSITLHISKCEEHVFEKMKEAIGKMAVDCHPIIGSYSVESETHKIE